MIDHDTFVRWCESRFDNIQVKGDEVKVHDIWWRDEIGQPDRRNHCWANTTKGCFHAWKSGKGGSLIELVAEVDKCSWEEAAQAIGATYSPNDFEAKLEKLLQDDVVDFTPKKKVELPPYTYLIDNLADHNHLKIQACKVLRERKIPTKGLYLCCDGKYRNRIIIPYYDREANLIYWNGRDISGKAKAKYRGPDKEEFNVGKSDVLWMMHWPAANQRIHLTEGEFDAMTLCMAGFNGAACGSKNVDGKQIEMLRDYRVTFCFDNDKAGATWLEVAEKMMEIGFRDIAFIRPPQGFKDWNALLEKTNEKIIHEYILQQETLLTVDTINRLRFDQI